MLGVIREDLPGHFVTNFFLQSIYENVFIVSTTGKLLAEIQQIAWRMFISSEMNQDAPMSELLLIFETSPLATELNRSPAGRFASRFGRVSVELDAEGRVVRSSAKFSDAPMPRASGLIMAGGFGRRLGEMTRSTPKPMLHVSGKPIAEHIVAAMVDNGITDIWFSIFHLGEVVKEHFGDGSRFGCRIRYIEETVPLGTAGCLSLIDDPIGTPMLVVNGDVLTNLQFGRVLDLHERFGAALTMSTRQHHFHIPYGVVESSDGYVTHIKEKPKIKFDINVAIYVLSESVFQYTIRNKRIDMPEFIESLMPQGLQIATFPLVEEWIDVGSMTDFNRALHSYDPGDRPSLTQARADPLRQVKS